MHTLMKLDLVWSHPPCSQPTSAGFREQALQVANWSHSLSRPSFGAQPRSDRIYASSRRSDCSSTNLMASRRSGIIRSSTHSDMLFPSRVACHLRALWTVSLM